MAEAKKYISLENLTLYDQLIKEKIDAADAKSLKIVEIDGNTLKFYKEVPPLSDPKPTPAYSIELPYEDMTEFKTKLTTLIGDDSGKSVRTIAAEEMARQLIPENAKESMDTLAEIAQWIASHPDDAAAMNKSISELKTTTATLETNLAAEVTRATTAEEGLSDRITDLEGKIGSENAFATEDEIKALFS